MTSIYHAGELAVQARVGVQAAAESLGKGIGTIIKPAARDFLQSQQLAIASTIDPQGRVWASLLTGEPGFIQVVAAQIVQISQIGSYSTLWREHLQTKNDIGILVIDLATRRRLRLNGKVEIQANGEIYLHTQQVYFNCPKYIQLRQINPTTTQPPAKPKIQLTETLTPAQQQWIAQTDTFFLASCHPESGADASHRGGYPGFVRSLSASQLVFPDYAGNNMFNSLGNIFVNPDTGLLFLDFERGSTLQLTGKAQIVWDRERVAEFIGGDRLVEFQIDQVLEITDATPLHWQFQEYSPFNPA